MSSAMAPLKESQFFLDFITAVSNPVISILVGIAVTAVIQSCSASIGILQALSITGVISDEFCASVNEYAERYHVEYAQKA